MLLKNDGKKKGKVGFCRWWVGHGRATTGTGRANLLVFEVGKACDGTAVPLQARAVPSFWHIGAQNFFSPFS